MKVTFGYTNPSNTSQFHYDNLLVLLVDPGTMANLPIGQLLSFQNPNTSKDPNLTGQTALAVTDHGTLSSHREMQIACKEQGIKPILGVEAYISPTDRFDRSSKTDKSIQAYNHIILSSS